MYEKIVNRYILFFNIKLILLVFVILLILNSTLGPDGPLGPKGEKGSVGEWGDFGSKGLRVCSIYIYTHSYTYLNVYIIYTYINVIVYKNNKIIVHIRN